MEEKKIPSANILRIKLLKQDWDWFDKHGLDFGEYEDRFTQEREDRLKEERHKAYMKERKLAQERKSARKKSHKIQFNCDTEFKELLVKYCSSNYYRSTFLRQLIRKHIKEFSESDWAKEPRLF